MTKRQDPILLSVIEASQTMNVGKSPLDKWVR